MRQIAIIIPSSFALTISLEFGQKARVFPLTGAASSKLPSGLPSVRETKEAASVHLREVHTKEVSSSPVPSQELNRRDWFFLLLREYLGLSASDSIALFSVI